MKALEMFQGWHYIQWRNEITLSKPLSSSLLPRTSPMPARALTVFSPIGSATKSLCFCDVDDMAALFQDHHLEELLGERMTIIPYTAKNGLIHNSSLFMPCVLIMRRSSDKRQEQVFSYMQCLDNHLFASIARFGCLALFVFAQYTFCS